MTDGELFEYYTHKYSGQGWRYYISGIPTNYLIRLTRHISKYSEGWGELNRFNVSELKKRTISDEMKLEVLLLIGVQNDR